MLTIQKQAKYLRQKIQLPTGEWAFVVFELQGNTWKAIHGEIIHSEQKFSDFKEKIFALPIFHESEHITPIISPFFSEVKILIKDLAFAITQPTRAPNF